MDRSDDRSRQDSRMIRQELPMLSIHEDEPSRYDFRAPKSLDLVMWVTVGNLGPQQPVAMTLELPKSLGPPA